MNHTFKSILFLIIIILSLNSISQSINTKYLYDWDKDFVNIIEKDSLFNFIESVRYAKNEKFILIDGKKYFYNLKKEAKYKEKTNIELFLLNTLQGIPRPKSKERVVINIALLIDERGFLQDFYFSGGGYERYNFNFDYQVYNQLSILKLDNWKPSKIKCKRVSSIKFIQLLW